MKGIIGYGSQGHAHALNLHDSGVDVTVGVRKDGASWKKASAAGLKVATVEDAVRGADIVMMLIPDENIAQVYRDQVLPNIKQGASCHNLLQAVQHSSNNIFSIVKA